VTGTSKGPERARLRARQGAGPAGHLRAGRFPGLLAALLWAASACGAPAGQGRLAAAPPEPAPFAWFRPGPAPSGWKALALPDGTAVLSVPPGSVAAESDPGSVSATVTGPDGDLLIYLNATPQQGEETQGNWAEFRLAHLRGEHAAAADRLSSRGEMFFRGGTGACVADSYVTRVGAQSYREIACLVTGGRASSVVVVAAPAQSWHLYSPLLEQAVNSYLVR
jgi:hypothetical protein